MEWRMHMRVIIRRCKWRIPLAFSLPLPHDNVAFDISISGHFPLSLPLTLSFLHFPLMLGIKSRDKLGVKLPLEMALRRRFFPNSFSLSLNTTTSLSFGTQALVQENSFLSNHR